MKTFAPLTLIVLLALSVAGSAISSSVRAQADVVDVEVAIAPLVDDFVIAWHFDNSSKEWKFYDPRPAFAAHNTLKELVEGKIYSINVRADRDPVVFGAPHRLLAGWNVIALIAAGGGGSPTPMPETPTPTPETPTPTPETPTPTPETPAPTPEPPSGTQVGSPLGNNAPLPEESNADAVLGFVPPAGGSCSATVFPDRDSGTLSVEASQVFIVCFVGWNSDSQFNLTLSDPSGQTNHSSVKNTNGSGASTCEYPLLHREPLGSYQLTATQAGQAGPGILKIDLSATAQPRVGVRPAVVTAGNNLEIGLAGLTPSTTEDLLFYRSCTLLPDGTPNLLDCPPDPALLTGFVFVGFVPSVQISANGEARLTMSTIVGDPAALYQAVILDAGGDVLALAEFEVSAP